MTGWRRPHYGYTQRAGRWYRQCTRPEQLPKPHPPMKALGKHQGRIIRARRRTP